MPVYVNEVVIQVEVGGTPPAAAPAAGSTPAPVSDRQALVDECVERVLEILREREEP